MTVQVSILPDDVIQSILEENSSNTFIRLPHPRTGFPTLFLPQKNRIFELQAVEPVNSRSWFVENQVVSDGRLLILTLLDPVFLLVPILRSLLPKDGSQGHFRTSDDIFEEAVSKMEEKFSKEPLEAARAKEIRTFTSLECCTLALSLICDIQNIPPDIIVYRFSYTKLVQYLQLKVQNLINSGLIDGSRTLVRNLAKDGLMEDGNEKLLESGRLKVGCDLVGQYLPPDIRAMLVASYSFSELDAHLNKLEEEKRLRAQQTASTSAKRGKAVAKETPTEKVDKRKAPKASQGVEKLKKANINGMAKLSTFFTKKT
ncbi:hypothetical protein GYMLUDRAFT_238529 [Collybiopsis luxurians FD-317 M1]|nr:hypothetical protein GYMLUDRAFT_238529 [Collybiopsis luxurians FD-317 M1]